MRPGPVAGVLREAQLNCTPVVISSVPGAAERVTHDVNGVLVESLEPADFARHMDALVDDSRRWRQMAYDAHALVKDWTWSKTAANFLTAAKSSGLMRDTPEASPQTD
jgi:glycosyltransferase involved in cell wall biosynthesis